jgi:hypothetical protein
LFYLSLDGNVMAVDVTRGPVLKAGVPEPLFRAPVDHRSGKQGLLEPFAWAVTSDGERFLINTRKTASQAVTVVLNWDAELRKR